MPNLPSSFRSFYHNRRQQSLPERSEPLLLVHLGHAVPHPTVVVGVTGGQGGALQLEPGLDQVQGMHDQHLHTPYNIIIIGGMHGA